MLRSHRMHIIDVSGVGSIAMADNFQIEIMDWQTGREALSAVRRDVFIMEQGVPEEIELDDRDIRCTHALGLLNGTPVACGRLVPDGHIGRVAVVAAYRGRGYGKAVMCELIDLARDRGMEKIGISSQVQALSFYETLGFTPIGEEFMEAGIAHRKMVLILTTD